MRTIPLILGIGGTTRAGSGSEMAMRAILAAAELLGAQTAVLTNDDLDLPIYVPGRVPPAAAKLIDLVRRCDGLLIATPAYHGGISGLVKNAIDYIEELRTDERPYLEARAVGCIVCAGGAQAIGVTLISCRSIVHALRGWPTPLGIGINMSAQPVNEGLPFAQGPVGQQLSALAAQVVEFARLQALARDVQVAGSQDTSVAYR